MTNHYQSPPAEKILYSPLQNPLTIRLLVLQPNSNDEPIEGHFIFRTLSTGNSDNLENAETPYCALSYCWGEDRSIDHFIKVNNQSFGVTSHLHSALQQLRKNDLPVVLWIDALCINQQDIEERSRQVAIMRLVYLSAERVVIWLGVDEQQEPGSSTPSSGLALWFLELVGKMKCHSYPLSDIRNIMDSIISLILSEFDPTKDIDNEATKGEYSHAVAQKSLLPTFLASVDELLQSSWFNRVWVLQEAVLAPQDLTVLCGENSIGWEDFWSALLSIWKLKREPVVQESHLLHGLGSVTFIAQLRYDWQRGEGSIFDLLSLVARSRVRQTTDPRDKVYGLLGLLNPELLLQNNFGSISDSVFAFTVDYSKSVEQIYEEFAVWCMTAGKSLDILNYSYNAASSLRLPSWVPDWSIPTTSSLSWDASPSMYNAGGSRPFHLRCIPSHHQIYLTGLQIDTVKSVARLTHEEGEMENPRSETWTEWYTLSQTARYYTLEEIEEPFWRTIVSDRKTRTERADDETGVQFHTWFHGRDGFPAGQAAAVETHNSAEFLHIMSLILLGRRLFVTECGFLGMADGGIRTGDGIFVLNGGALCFILRAEDSSSLGGETQDRVYRLIDSGAYVHGLADGEGLAIAETRGLESQEYCII